MGVITEAALATEGRRYGAAGPRPQVVWANGILASAAVGLSVDLLTDWTGELRHAVYLEYHGNKGTVHPAKRLEHAPATCDHYRLTDVGDPDL
jgi:hypothetical protein